MNKQTRQAAILASLCCWLGMSIQMYAQDRFLDSMILEESLIQYVRELRYSHPDSALQLLDLSFETYIQAGDTLGAIKVLVEHANISGNLANYKDAYDKLWRGLSLADEANIHSQKARFYREIGRYYSFYKRKEKAFEYFQISLDINRDLLAQGKIEKVDLIPNYYTFCATYRELDEFSMARKYLDSCFLFFTPGTNSISEPALQFELACIQHAEGKYAKALATFEEIRDWFEAKNPSYLVLFYTYMSDSYLELNRFSESEILYNRALEISTQYHMHVDFSPLIHEKLSELYFKKGEYQKAYHSLRKMKDLDETFFDSRSANNRSLLEIQDAFRLEQEAQAELIQQQKLERLEHEEDVWFLQRVILMVSIFFLLIIGYLYFSYIRTRYKAEKQIIRKEKQLELEKAKEVLEIKNKELATSALKLIEKDENMSLLKNKIKQVDGNGNVDVRELKQVLKSISISNDRNWNEFETRFVAVNESFYQRLQDKFPELSQRDLKICALIKLNFSSKDMAKLLGISVESAHTSRYRLRKKLKITRDVNLTEFIAKQ